MPSHNHNFTGTAVNSGNASPSTSSAGGHQHNLFGTGATATYSVAGHGDVGSYLGRRGPGNSDQYNYSAYYTNSTGSHSHTVCAHSHSVTAAGTISSCGSGQAANNMPPYIVKYCWERIA